MDRLSSPFAFCLQATRLNSEPIQTSRQCQLTIHPTQTTKNIHLQLSGCIFNANDQNSTIITSKFPNIFIDSIINDTWAFGRIFQEVISNTTQVNQWNIINTQVCLIIIISWRKSCHWRDYHSEDTHTCGHS